MLSLPANTQFISNIYGPDSTQTSPSENFWLPLWVISSVDLDENSPNSTCQ